MDEHSLRQLLTQSPLLSQVKVLAKNEFDHQIPGMYIVNNQVRGHVGQHWLAFFVTDKTIELFDSYGKPPCTYGFSSNFVHSLKCIQSSSSLICWAYCIYYLLKRSSGISMQNIVSVFSYYDLDYNDDFVLTSLQW